MKKSVFLIISLVLFVSLILCSCDNGINGIKSEESKEISNTSESEALNGVANPVEELESVDQIKDQTGIEMVDVKDVKNKTYSVIKGDVMIGQIQFTYKDADFTYRAAETEGDISGVYADFDGEIKAAGDAVSKNQKPVSISGSELYSRWFDDNGVQYSLYSAGAVKADYEMIYSQVKK